MPYLSKTFDAWLKLLETFLGRIHVKVKNMFEKMITSYSVFLRLSKFTLPLLFWQGTPGWLNSINYSFLLYKTFMKTRMPHQFSWFFENLFNIIKKNCWKLAKNASRKILNEVNQNVPNVHVIKAFLDRPTPKKSAF